MKYWFLFKNKIKIEQKKLCKYILNKMESKEYICFKKIIIFGSGGSGKSCLTSYFENKEFKEESPSDTGN